MQSLIQGQLARFRAKFGRDPKPDDPIFFDLKSSRPRPINDRDVWRADEDFHRCLAEAGAPPDILYAHRKTGRLVVSKSAVECALDEHYDEFWEAVSEYRRRNEIGFEDQTSRKYAGESTAKKWTRLMLYESAARVFEATAWPGGWAVVLTGPLAADAGPLLSLWRWPRRRILLCDVDRGACERAERLATGCRIVQGPLEEALALTRGDGVGFANLDFMGHFGGSVQACLRQLRSQLRPYGIVAYTFLRGRETDGITPRWAEAQALARALRVQTRDGARFVAYQEFVREALRDPDMPTVYAARYDSGRSPMGIVALQRISQSLRGPRWHKAARFAQTIQIGDSRAFEELLRETTLRWAGQKNAPSVQTIEDAFALPRGTVTAWKAVRTRTQRDAPGEVH